MADPEPPATGTLDFTLPSLGSDMDSGTVIGWHVEVGDRVAKGDVLLDVDTEKSEIEVEVWYDATVVEIVAAPGAEVAVGGVLARLEPTDGQGAPRSSAPVAASSAPSTVADATRIPAVARPVAGGAYGAGDTGRQEVDVPGPRTVYWKVGEAPTLSRATSVAGQGAVAGEARDRERRSRVRRAISDLMSRANEIPHYYLSREVDMEAAVAWLEQTNARRVVAERILPAAMLIRAVAMAAGRSPELNGHWIDGRFHAKQSIDLGVAVHLRGGGLMVPVIADAGRLSVDELMAKLRELVSRARSGRVRSADLEPGSLTVTNIGDAGADQVLGLVHPPQVALVGIGRIHEVARVIERSVEPRAAVTMTLAADHRATDGHVGARFLQAIDHALQSPEAL